MLNTNKYTHQDHAEKALNATTRGMVSVAMSHYRSAFAKAQTQKDKDFYTAQIAGLKVLSERAYIIYDKNREIFYAVKHGQVGATEINISSTEAADLINKRQGLTRGMVSAAQTCSMFDVWENFHDIAQTVDRVIKEQANTGRKLFPLAEAVQ